MVFAAGLLAISYATLVRMSKHVFSAPYLVLCKSLVALVFSASAFRAFAPPKLPLDPCSIVVALLRTVLLMLAPLALALPITVSLDANSIFCLVVGPVSEELLFRAVVNDLAGNLVGSCLFGMVHYDFSSRSMVQVLFTFVFGLYASYIYQHYGIIACMIIHSYCNLIGFPDLEHFLGLDANHKFYLALIQLVGTIISCTFIPFTI